MSLCDIDAVLKATPEFTDKEVCRSGSDRWQQFYEEYLQPTGVPSVPFPQRSFGDGGYLDNKPFSYAIDTLVKRHAEVPVKRKLIYVEPAPDHPENESLRDTKPDAIENAMAALVSIPGYETIRSDLQAVLQRNREMQRVKRLLALIEQDIEQTPEPKVKEAGEEGGSNVAGAPPVPPLQRGEWANLDAADMLARGGRSYVPPNPAQDLGGHRRPGNDVCARLPIG